MVYAWRRKPRVAENMLTSGPDCYENHVKWFRGLKFPYWVIHHGEAPIGVINLGADDTWGFYIGEDGALGIGGIALAHFFNFYFRDHARLLSTVKASNAGMLKLLRFFGHREIESTSTDSVALELTRDAWQEHQGMYGRWTAEFE